MKHLIHYFDNALTASIILTLFIALAIAANPYKPIGYTLADRRAMDKLVEHELAKSNHKLTNREALIELGWGKP